MSKKKNQGSGNLRIGIAGMFSLFFVLFAYNTITNFVNSELTVVLNQPPWITFLFLTVFFFLLLILVAPPELFKRQK